MQPIFPQINTLYKEYADKNRLPGYAFGVVSEGKLIHSGAGGYIDLEKKIPATSQSIFRIASITKSFTALAILKLRDENKLRLDDSIYTYVPELQKKCHSFDAPTITLRDLLTHTAGFPTDDPWADRRLHHTEEEFLTFLKNEVTFSNTPGTVFEYSNLGYTLLSIVIRKVSGLTYTDYIRQHIWKPLQMDQVAWDFSEVPNEQLVKGYRTLSDGWKEEELLPGGIFGAMGGMYSSIESFAPYVAMHQFAWPPRDDKEIAPFKRSSLREAHRPWIFDTHCQENDLTKAYGYGLNWQQDHLKRIYIGHSGGLPGFGCNWTMMPEYDLALIFFANTTYAPAAKTNLEMLGKIIELANLQPKKRIPSPPLTKRKKELVNLLPSWDKAQESGIFADNFFLDTPLATLKEESQPLFEKAGKILSIGEIVPKNELFGTFLLKGENSDLQATLALSPENPPRIQKIVLKENI